MKRIRQSRLQLLTITALTQFTLTTGLVSAQQPEVLRPIEFRLDGDALEIAEAPMKTDKGLKALVQSVANTFPCEPQIWNLQERIVGRGNILGTAVDIDANVAIVGSNSRSELAYIYRFNGAFWELEFTLDSPVTHANTSSGNLALAIDGNVIVISQPRTDFSGSDEFYNAANLGVVHVFRLDVTKQTWQLEASLTPGSPPVFANFGSDVAISGDTILVSAPGIERAYVYQRTGAGWIEKQQLIASDGVAGDGFGTSVAISGDLAIVSAPLQGLTDQVDGAAYLFQFNGTQWIEQVKLTEPLPPSRFRLSDQFATSVALDSNTAVIGSPFSKVSEATFSTGLAFVYRFDGITWNLIETLTPDLGEFKTRLGSSVDIEGSFIVAGAIGERGLDNSSGAIYVFQEVDGQWLRQSKLLAPNIAALLSFGQVVATNQGHILVSRKRPRNLIPNVSSVFHYTSDPPPDCNSNGLPDSCDINDNPSLDCNLNYVLDACDIANGFSTDCNGNQVPDDCEPDCDLNGVPDSCDLLSGFATDINSNSIPDSCECPVQRKLLPVFPKAWSRFGAHTRIDGDLAIVGAWGDNNMSGVETGAAYIYRRQGLNWTYSARLLASDGSAYANFGNFIDISGHVAVVGVPSPTGEWCSGNNAVYVYRYHPDTDQWIEEAILLLSDLTVSGGCSYGMGVDVEGDVLAVHTSISEADISYTVAIIYRYDAIAKTWLEEDRLPTSNIDMNPVAVWSPSNWIKLRGDRLIVGSANGLTGANGLIPGSAFIYRYVGGGWEFEQRLFSESGNPRDFFGFDVDLDGERAIVGSAWDDQARIDRGAARIYQFDGARWNLEQTLLPPLELDTTLFGVGVALRGMTAAILGVRAFPPSHGHRAVLFIYDYVQPLNQWVLRKTIQAFDGVGHSLGFPITTDGESIIFSSPGDSEAGPFTGAAYVVSGVFGPDCNANSIPDPCDIALGEAADTNNNSIPDECEFAPTDFNHDGFVNVTDLLTLLGAWGNCPPGSSCSADIDGDGIVGVTELLMLLADWG